MYELKNNGKLFTSKSVGTGPRLMKKRIYLAAVSQKLGNTDLYSYKFRHSRVIIREFHNCALLIYKYS